MNKKYLVYAIQPAEGCDYTIGCGQKAILLEAESLSHAAERFITMMGPDFDSDDVDWTDDYGGYYDERELKHVTIYELGEHPVELKLDTKPIYENFEQIAALQKRLAKEEEEKKLYLKLKQKYENNV